MSKTVNIEIKANASGAKKALDSTGKALDKFGKQASGANKSMAGLAVAGGAVGAVLGSVIVGALHALSASMSDAVKRLDSLNNFPRVMNNLGISAGEAQKAIKVLSDKLVGLPTTLDSASLSVQRFTSANGDIQASTAIFLALNNAILAGGAPMQMQAEAIEQISQAYTKGRFDVMEWRAMMSAMPAQLKQVAKALGYTSTAVGGDMQVALTNGTLSMNDFIATIVRLNNEGVAGFPSFAEQAKNSTNGVATSMQNLKTALTRALADIMNAIGQSNIAGFFNSIAGAINAVVPYIVGFVKVCVMAVQAVAQLFGGGNNGAKQLESSMQNVDKAVEGAGIGAGAVSGGLAGANKEAKKLSKQLAGFDEMNVLSEKASASGGGGGASAGGGAPIKIDTKGLFDGLEVGVSKADEVANKIRQAFENAYTQIAESPALISIEASFSNIAENVKETLNSIAPDIQQGFWNIKDTFVAIWEDMGVVADEKIPTITEKFDTFMNSLHAIIKPGAELIATIWKGLTGNMDQTWREHGRGIMSSVADTFIGIQEYANRIMTLIVEPIIVPALEALKQAFNDFLLPTIKNVSDFVAKLVKFALLILNQFVIPIQNFLVTLLAPAFQFVGGVIADVLSGAIRNVSFVVDRIVGILGGVIDFLTGVFTSDWGKAWQGVRDIFKNIIEGLAGIFKWPINSIIDGINAFINGVNNVKIPDWVPAVGGKGFHINKIPRLASGGVVDGATFAMVGERGAEAVMPLEHNTQWIDKLASRIAGNMSGGSNAPIELVVKVGEETLLDRIVEGINDRSFMRGTSVINI